jgi:hypothetical protein
MIKETFNVDVKYPHDHDEEYSTKIYNVTRHYTFYDYLVLLMIGGLALIVGYNMIESMEEKGYMLLIFFFIGFCALLS